jgi:hypothetical protein
VKPAHDEIVSEFDARGFVVRSGVLSEQECAVLDGHIAALGVAGAGIRDLLVFGWVQDLARQLRENPMVGSLLRNADAAVQCTYFAKSQSRNWLVALHQDLSIPVQGRVADCPCAGWSEKEGTWFCQPPTELLSNLVAIRVHLDDSTEQNGPLRIVPGTHRMGRIAPKEAVEHRRRFGDASCTVPRRGIVAMHPLLLHASSKSIGGAPRRVLHFVFGPALLPWGLQWKHAV